ncbi:MAG: Pseudogene of conserved hypothetical protein [Methanobrevibacter sp. CfCl-M3]
MRITKVNDVKHYKCKEGQLIKGNEKNKDCTKNKNHINEIFRERKESMQRSLMSSFLTKVSENCVNRKYRKFVEGFIHFLVFNEDKWNDFTEFKKLFNNKTEVNNSLNIFLTSKGKSDPYNILDLLEKIVECENDEELFKLCYVIRDNLNKKLDNKSNFLEKSIRENYLFSIKNNEIDYHSKRSEFLGKHMNKIFECENYNIFIEEIEKLCKEYSIEDLFENFKNNIFNLKDGDNNRVTAIDIKNTLNEYNSSIRDKLKNDTDLSIYSNEVKKYIEHYFPVSRKRNNINRRNFDSKYLKLYLNEKRIVKTVEKQLINALVQHIIKIGKFVYYYANNNDSGKYIWDGCTNEGVRYFTSSNLEEIKKREAFTKKIINTCVFATNNFRNIMKPDEKGDILLKPKFEKILNSLNNEEKQKIIKRLKHFFNIGFFDENNYKKLNDHLNLNNLNKLLIEVKNSIYFPRNNIYHFRSELKTKNILDYIFKNHDESGKIEMNDSVLKIFELDKTNVENNFLELMLHN